VIKSIRIRWVGHAARMRKRTGANRVLVGKPEGMRPPGTPRRRWEDNIKIDIQEVGWGHGQDYSGSGDGEAAGTCKRGNKPSGSI
jgi:hypothetical protein